MDLKFRKSERLLQHIEICVHLINCPAERTPGKMDCLMYMICFRDGRNIDMCPDKNMLKQIKAEPLPTVTDIEGELLEKCTCISDYTPLVKMLFNEWKGKLFPIDHFGFQTGKYGERNLDTDMLVGEMFWLNAEISELFDKLSANSGVPVPNLYRTDHIEDIFKALETISSEQTDNETLLPVELDTVEIKTILKKAIDAGLCNNHYSWKHTILLLSYFADTISHHFGLSNKRDKDGNPTTSWKPFAELFTVNGARITKEQLRDAKQNFMRYNMKFLPAGHETINALFEKLTYK